MAEIKQGILGPVNGKVGTVVGVTWRGVNYIRAKPRKSSKKPTEKQLFQWDKMSLVSTFASKFKDFVNAHCPAVYNGEKWITGKEQMISRLMKQGVKLINGLQHITVESALLSIGNLAPAVIKKINRLKTGKFKVQWDNGLINALTLDTDSLTMMLYNEKLNEFIAIPNVGKRVNKYAHFSLPDKWVEGKIYFWSMWKAEDGSVHSTSCFHGIIELENIEEETGNGKQKTGNTIPRIQHQVQTQYLACHTKQKNSEQESEKENHETSEVIPIEQAREISLKTFLKEIEIETSTEVEVTSPFTPPFKENKIVDQVHIVKQSPTIDSDKSSNEDKTTLSSVDASDKEKKLKKWTPPGYIRTVNKQIIKQPKDQKPTVQSDQTNEGVFDGVRSILEVPNISDN